MKRRRFIETVAVLSLAMVLLVAGDSTARTWRVEKDGTGDFTVIQEAVDVAASGDTVRIGVGRFDDKRYYSFPGWSDSVRVVVHQYELTITGSGPETIIGQEEPWELEQGNHKGIVAGQLVGVLDNSILRIQDLTLENMEKGVDTSHELVDGCYVEIKGCSFRGNWLSASLYCSVAGEALIADSEFDGIARNGIHVHGWGQDRFTLRDSTMMLTYDPIWNGSHLGAVNVSQLLVDECQFIGGSVGAVFTYGGPALIKNCRFEGQEGICIAPEPASDVTIENCIFENQYRTIQSIRADNRIEVSRSRFVGVSDCSFRIKVVGELLVNENDIGHGARGAVLSDDTYDCDTPRTLDFTDNYWFTDNPDSIAAWIHDRNDSDQACYYVDFEPFRSESTPVEQRSLSDFKALFR